MAVFAIDTRTGQVATRKQLVEAGIASPDDPGVPRPWLALQGPNDASTMWYAVMRKRERGVFIGALVLRHQGRHALLVEQGWEEVPISDIRAPADAEDGFRPPVLASSHLRTTSPRPPQARTSGRRHLGPRKLPPPDDVT